MKKDGICLLFLFLLLFAGIMLGSMVREAVAETKEEPAASAPLKTGEPKDDQAAKEECPEKGRGDECPATFGPIITDTAVPIDKGKFAVQPTFFLSFITDYFNRNWQRVSAGGDFRTFRMDWKFTYGLWNNLEVYAVVPYVHQWASNVSEPGPKGERAADFGGIGDVSLTLKYRLVEETVTLPTVSLLFTTTFPTGHYKRLNPRFLGTDLIGSGSYIFTTGFNLSKYLRPVIIYANLWYSLPTSYTDDEGRQHPRDYVTVNLAAEYPITKKWVALLELNSFWDGGRLFGPKANTSPRALLSILPGLEFMATEKFSMALGVSIDLTGKNNNAAVMPVFSMVYAF